MNLATYKKFKGDRLIVTEDGVQRSANFFTLHGKTNPRCIDFRANRGEDDPNMGLYRLDGDTLTASIGWDARPRDLSGNAGSHGVWVMKRRRPSTAR